MEKMSYAFQNSTTESRIIVEHEFTEEQKYKILNMNHIEIIGLPMVESCDEYIEYKLGIVDEPPTDEEKYVLLEQQNENSQTEPIDSIDHVITFDR